jgi:hypothetical protein
LIPKANNSCCLIRNISRKEVHIMSNRELAKSLIDQIPESKLLFIIPYLQGAALPDEVPNADTLEAMAELENGSGHKFSGSTEDLFAELMED